MNLQKKILSIFLMLCLFSGCAPEMGKNESTFNLSQIPQQELPMAGKNEVAFATNTRASITVNSIQLRNTCVGYNPDGSDLVYTFTITTFTSLRFITLATCTLSIVSMIDSLSNVYTPVSTPTTLQLGASNTFSTGVAEYQSGSLPIFNFSMSWDASIPRVYIDYIANEDAITSGTIYAVDQKLFAASGTTPPTIGRIDMNDTNFNMRLSLVGRRGAVYSDFSAFSTGCAALTSNPAYTCGNPSGDFRYWYFNDPNYLTANNNPPVSPTITWGSNKALNNTTETFTLPLDTVGKCFIMVLASDCNTHSFSCPEANGCAYAVLTNTRY